MKNYDVAENSSRTFNVLKNTFISIATQICVLGFSFVTRTILIRYLTQEYLGVDGLFSNIILLISLAESGGTWAFQSLLYKPIHDNDYAKINALFKMMRRFFAVVGCVALFLGIVLFRFLYFFVGDTQVESIEIIYFMYLGKVVFEYFFTSYLVLIDANQRHYIYVLYYQTCNIIGYIIRVVAIVLFDNFLLYVFVMDISTVLVFLLVRKRARELYPFILEKSNINIGNVYKKELVERIYAGFIIHVSYVILNGTDALVISHFFSLGLVGVYSNYLILFNLINAFLQLVYNSVTASIGDLIASDDVARIYDNFNMMYMIMFIINSIIFICSVSLMNPFIMLWAGKDYLFDFSTLILICLSMFLGSYGIKNVITVYKLAAGLLSRDKYIELIGSACNITLSIVLARRIGINGVFIGTIVSSVFSWVSGLYVLHKYLFKRSAREFFMKNIGDVSRMLIVFIVVLKVKDFIVVTNFLTFMVALFACLSITVVFLLILFNRDEEMISAKEYMKNVLNERIAKLRG